MEKKLEELKPEELKYVAGGCGQGKKKKWGVTSEEF